MYKTEIFIYNYIPYNYMKTTIQIHGSTLELLKSLKDNTKSNSYDELINRMALKIINKESMFGYLGKKNKSEILEGLRDKSDRF